MSGVFELKDVFEPPRRARRAERGADVVATVIAFAVGYAAIAWLLRYVAHHTLYVFVLYRVALGPLVLALLLTGTISATCSVVAASLWLRFRAGGDRPRLRAVRLDPCAGDGRPQP